jgi:hypothetical protein
MITKWETVLNFLLPFRETKDLLDFKTLTTVKSKANAVKLTFEYGIKIPHVFEEEKFAWYSR